MRFLLAHRSGSKLTSHVSWPSCSYILPILSHRSCSVSFTPSSTVRHTRLMLWNWSPRLTHSENHQITDLQSGKPKDHPIILKIGVRSFDRQDSLDQGRDRRAFLKSHPDVLQVCLEIVLGVIQSGLRQGCTKSCYCSCQCTYRKPRQTPGA